jgi:hypothetical protein
MSKRQSFVRGTYTLAVTSVVKQFPSPVQVRYRIPLVSQLGGYSAGRNYRSIVPASLAFPGRYRGSGSTKAYCDG